MEENPELQRLLNHLKDGVATHIFATLKLIDQNFHEHDECKKMKEEFRIAHHKLINNIFENDLKEK
jgi:hypothetical protein